MELDNELVAEELGHIRKIFGRYTAISSSGRAWDNGDQ